MGLQACTLVLHAVMILTNVAIHISEEIPQPGRRVPQVMSVTVATGLLSSLPLMIALTFCMKDIEAVTSSPLPSLELLYQALVFRALVIFLDSRTSQDWKQNGNGSIIDLASRRVYHWALGTVPYFRKDSVGLRKRRKSVSPSRNTVNV